jgi:lipopolysaccharide export LptBFGC system permease protein LptF
MTTEFKKLILFGVLISFMTSAYVSLLNTFAKYGLNSDHFVLHWLSLIPKTYLLVLPFVLLGGPLVRKLVDYTFLKLKI